MGEITNEHRIGGLEARMAIMEQSHLRLETKIEKQLETLAARVGGIYDLVNAGRGVKLTIVSVGGVIGWIVGIVVLAMQALHS